MQAERVSGRAVVALCRLEDADAALGFGLVLGGRSHRAERTALRQSMLPPRPVLLVRPDRLGWSSNSTAGLLGPWAIWRQRLT